MVVDFASQRGGHCFRDLLDGDAETGQAVHSETHLTVRPWVWSRCESAGAYLLARTFSNDFPESVVPDHSNLLGRELLPEFIIGVRELGFVVLSLRNGRGVPMTINSHCYMYK